MSPDEEEAKKTAMERAQHDEIGVFDSWMSSLDERRLKNPKEEQEESEFPVLDTVAMLRES